MSEELKASFEVNQLGCEYTFNPYVPINNVGVVELEPTPQFNLFPNPNEGKFTIQSKEEMEWITIYSLAGKEIINLKVQDTKKQVDLNDLDAGVYLVSVHFNDQIVTKRLVVR
jgi:hypothetical protein